MKKSIVILLLASGCGSGVGGASSVCASLGFDPSAVQTVYTLVQSDRATGFTSHEELNAIASGCDTQACLQCGAAIVDEVYGF